MPDTYFCYTHDQLEVALMEYRGNLINAGRTPEQADAVIHGIREFHNSPAARANHLLQPPEKRKTT